MNPEPCADFVCRCEHPLSVHTDWYVEEITGDAGYACRLCSCVEAEHLDGTVDASRRSDVGNGQ